MIHVDVRRIHQQDGLDLYGYVVQTSVDGGGWKTQYILGLTEGDKLESVLERAKHTARVFAAGCEYATGERPRMTAMGYAL